ncbi:hypothetical protein F5Y06DRAFT_295856 [Hypoxylon sp. FL0890]|nr:hypothetical protein F5Y06DRAFT_295856 [Hypoxylon sp. FL0890]
MPDSTNQGQGQGQGQCQGQGEQRPFIYIKPVPKNQSYALPNAIMSHTTSTFETIETAHKFLSAMSPGQKMDHIRAIEEAIQDFKKSAAGALDEDDRKIIQDRIDKLEDFLEEAKSSPEGWDLYIAGLLVFSALGRCWVRDD